MAKNKKVAAKAGMIQPSDAGTGIELTLKQQKFVDHYNLYGVGIDAARAAGYKGNDVTLASVATENLKKPQIASAIKSQREELKQASIATAQERHEFLTSVMRGAPKSERELQAALKIAADTGDVSILSGPSYGERIKAAEVLCKINGEFIEKKQVTGDIVVRVVRGDSAPSAIGRPIKKGDE